MAAISSVPGLLVVNCFCCSGILVGGLIAVYVFKKSEVESNDLSFRTGIQLGLLAGLFATALNTLVALFFPHDIFHQLMELSDSLIDPIVWQWPESMDSILAGRGFMLLTFLSSLVINTLFGALGGVFGVLMFGDKDYAKQSKKSTESDDDIIVEDVPF